MGRRRNEPLKPKSPPRFSGATVEFVDLDGDAHLDVTAVTRSNLRASFDGSSPASSSRQTPIENQHVTTPSRPTGADAARLARYAGVKEIADLAVHAIDQLFFYAVTPEGEPPGTLPVVFDVSAFQNHRHLDVRDETHASQAATRKYIDLQLARARCAASKPASSTRSHCSRMIHSSFIRSFFSNAARGHSDMSSSDALQIGITCYPSIAAAVSSLPRWEKNWRVAGMTCILSDMNVRSDCRDNAPRLHFHPVVVNDYGLFKYPITPCRCR